MKLGADQEICRVVAGEECRSRFREFQAIVFVIRGGGQPSAAVLLQCSSEGLALNQKVEKSSRLGEDAARLRPSPSFVWEPHGSSAANAPSG